MIVFNFISKTSTSSYHASLCEVLVLSEVPGCRDGTAGSRCLGRDRAPASMAPAQAMSAFISCIHAFPQAVNSLGDFFLRDSEWEMKPVVPAGKGTCNHPEKLEDF